MYNTTTSTFFKTALYSIHNAEQTLQGTKLHDKRVGSEEK